MVENPQLECLPEHRGPAFNTWQIIMQTAMEKSLQPSPPSEPQLATDNGKKSSAPDEVDQGKTTEDTNSSVDDSDMTTDEKQANRKKSLTSSSSVDSTEEADSKIGVAPWKSYPLYPQNTHGLHLEIIDFYRHISPLPEEEVMRQDVVSRMCELITRILPGAKVEVFGSFQTCLYLPSSDIDLAVFGDWDKLPLFALKEALISSDVAEPNSVKVLDKASVPIIKLRDKQSKVRVDISFNTDASVKSVAMIKTYLKKFPLLPYLFLTLKHFLVQRDLNEVFTGGISSYCLLLLTVSFFQRPQLRMHHQQMDLGIMLMEFLELYGRNLNYQRIGIKIKDGGCYISKDKLTTDLANGEYPALLCIEDPVTLATDIGKSSYGILRVKEAFEYAFNVIDIALRTKYYFKVNPNSTYLSRIISISQEQYDYRKWVRKTYRPMLNMSRQGLPRSLFQDNIHNDGKPPLLPTPTLYSPRLHLANPPPFSPFSTNSNGIMFNQFGFIGNNKVGPQQQLSQQQITQQQLPQQQLSQQQILQQQLLLGNITSNVPTCVPSNKDNRVPIHVNQPNSSYLTRLPHDNSNSVSCLPPTGLIFPRMVNPSHRQSFSIMKPKTNISLTQNNKNDKGQCYQNLSKQQDFYKSRSNEDPYRTYSPKSLHKSQNKYIKEQNFLELVKSMEEGLVTTEEDNIHLTEEAINSSKKKPIHCDEELDVISITSDSSVNDE